jgi:predicted enzyme related to lactoylglutathione lyase
MGSEDKVGNGAIIWRDLTVENAPRLREFYTRVAGWKSDPVSMGDYQDYSMLAEGGETVAGICHSRGGNAGLPAQWLIYIKVADLDRSIAECTALGGTVIHGPRAMGDNRFCVIEDPAGAVAGLIQ